MAAAARKLTHAMDSAWALVESKFSDFAKDKLAVLVKFVEVSTQFPGPAMDGGPLPG